MIVKPKDNKIVICRSMNLTAVKFLFLVLTTDRPIKGKAQEVFTMGWIKSGKFTEEQKVNLKDSVNFYVLKLIPLRVLFLYSPSNPFVSGPGAAGAALQSQELYQLAQYLQVCTLIRISDCEKIMTIFLNCATHLGGLNHTSSPTN